MKLVFVSNFYNHHQKPLSDAFSKNPDVEYYFIETKPISEERLKFGWGKDEKPNYVKTNYKSEKDKIECQKLIDQADVAIWGGAPRQLFEYRLKHKKLTFLYSERIYKKGYEYHKLLYSTIRHFFVFPKHKNLHLLCAGAYTAADFAKTGCFIGKTYKWGYFPKFEKYDDVETFVSEKQKNSILWAARFIDWKHPEIPVGIAKRLKADGYDFTLNLIGNGEMVDEINKTVREYNLDDCVHLLGSMQPNEVRRYMEQSEVFLFTSDRNEGWGAVANEAMNSCCAVIANHAIGSVPFLIKSGDNGLIYRDGDIDDVYNKVKWLLDNPNQREIIAKNAYNTIKNQWNADIASDRFLGIANQLLCGNKVNPYPDGICSKAERLRDDWIDKQ